MLFRVASKTPLSLHHLRRMLVHIWIKLTDIGLVSNFIVIILSFTALYCLTSPLSLSSIISATPFALLSSDTEKYTQCPRALKCPQPLQWVSLNPHTATPLQLDCYDTQFVRRQESSNIPRSDCSSRGPFSACSLVAHLRAASSRFHTIRAGIAVAPIVNWIAWHNTLSRIRNHDDFLGRY